MDDRPASLSATARSSPNVPSSGRGWDLRTDADGAIVALSGDWTAGAGASSQAAATEPVLKAAAGKRLAFDGTKLGRWDTTLLIFVAELRDAASERDVRFDVTGLPQAAARLLALSEEAAPIVRRKKTDLPLVNRVGQAVLETGDGAMAGVTLLGDTILSGQAALRGRARIRGEDLMACMYEAGVAALPIVTTVNLLVGGIIAFVGAVQLRRFDAGIFIADLVVVATVREMSALMTAIIMAGRTGGAYAALISTMLGNEEIDALHALGIPVSDYLTLPRILALTAMMPLLYLYGCAVGILGGFAVAVAMLNLTSESFIEEARQAIAANQLVFGLTKSVAFGALIAIVGCRCGLSAGRSAADVGRAATRAVVIGIVGVIALDAVFAVCANALDF